jgi:hypothetical protein
VSWRRRNNPLVVSQVEPRAGEAQLREQRARRRERMAISVLSLLILFTLLGGYFYLRATQEQEGKLAVVSSSGVTFSINEAPAAPDDAPSSGEASPTATAGAAARGGPAISSEVLGGAGQPAASAAPASNAQPSSGGARAQAQATAAASPTSAARSGVSIGTSGASGSGGNPGANSGGGGNNSGSGNPPPQPTSTPGDDAPGGGVPTATAPAGDPGPTSTPRPTRTPAPPTATPFPDEVTPLGHNSHLHIDGFVGPGAYTTGGIRVTNLGQVAFNYSLSMSTSGSAQFAQLLKLRIYLRVGASCDYRGPPPSPGGDLLPLTGDQVGTELYVGNFASGNKFGNPAVELAAGDRFLDIGEDEVLCMEVFFPWTAGNEYQGLAVNGTMIFTAKSPE